MHSHRTSYCPDAMELLISEGVQVLPNPPTETNHHGNQRLLSVRNASVDAENKISTIKAVVQPEIGGSHPRTFIVMIGGNPSIQMARLGRRF